MKKFELLGLSLITAALVMTSGCSSDDDDGKSGPSAPSEITQGVELNTSATNNAMALLGVAMDDMPELAPARLTPRLSALKVARSSGSENSTVTYPCEISGTYTITNNSKSTGDSDKTPPESWSEESHNSKTYDNCVDNYSGVNFSGDALDQVVRNGVLSAESNIDEDGDEGEEADIGFMDDYAEYNSDTNRSKLRNSLNMSYSEIYRSSTTEATITSTYDFAFSVTSEFDGTDADRKDINITDSLSVNGSVEKYQTNAAGERVAGVGERIIYGDYKQVSERLYVPARSTGTLHINGFYTLYETNSTGEHLIEGGYFNNYHVESVKVGDEQETTISGTIGDTCLGGSITVAVDPVIKDNEVTYPDQLPYAGKATLKGSNTSTVTFSINSGDPTKTQATVQVDDGPLTQFDDWASLATGECEPEH
jgi:hypothetical protein